MALRETTRKWLVAIVVAIVAILVTVWLYTGWAADEVEPEVGDDVSLGATATPDPPPPPPLRLARH